MVGNAGFARHPQSSLADQRLASYSEMLYAAHSNGPSALENEVRDTDVEALTVDNVPVIQAARLEDYSPELRR